MSREIKFRIWDDKKKEWLGESDGDTLTYYGFHLVGEVMTVQAPPQWALDEGMVVEQYTGLKGKNGKEIYEGDIVRFDIGLTPAEVIYQEGTYFLRAIDDWSLFFDPESEKPCPLGWIDPRGLEIVGNIHENPELLEGGRQ